MEHVMPLYVIGLAKTWQEYLVLAGWEHSCPKTPAPTKQMLTLHDPEGKVTEAEIKLVLKRGYMNLCGGLVWPIKQCYPEMLYGVSNITICVKYVIRVLKTYFYPDQHNTQYAY